MQAIDAISDKFDRDPGDEDAGNCDWTEVPNIVVDRWSASHRAAKLPPLERSMTPEIGNARIKEIRALLASNRNNHRAPRRNPEPANLQIPANRDAQRKEIWANTKLGVRIFALLAAKIPKHRAQDSLDQFTKEERDRIAAAVDSLHLQLGQLRCSVFRTEEAVASPSVTDGAPQITQH